MLLQMALFHSILWLSNIPLYKCTTSSLSIHLSVDIGDRISDKLFAGTMRTHIEIVHCLPRVPTPVLKVVLSFSPVRMVPPMKSCRST